MNLIKSILTSALLTVFFLLSSCGKNDQAVFALQIKNSTNYSMVVNLVDNSGFPRSIKLLAKNDTVIASVRVRESKFDGPVNLLRENFSSMRVSFPSNAYETAEMAKDKPSVNCKLDPFNNEADWDFEEGTVYVSDQYGMVEVYADIYSLKLEHSVLTD